MKKVIFVFAGTGDPGVESSAYLEKHTDYEEDVISVYIAGCQNTNVGGKDYLSGMIAPDIGVGIRNISSAFTEDGKLDFKKLRKNLGSGLNRIGGLEESAEGTPIEIEAVCLTGFSRGAVTAIGAAKELDKFGFSIHIIADQPVPGETSESGPLYSKYHDLTACEHILSATTLFASHDLRNGILHDNFFSQMLAKFPPECNVQNILLPHQHHLVSSDFGLHSPRLNIELANIGFVYQGSHETKLIAAYERQRFTGYTPEKFAQKILGGEGQIIPKDPIYLQVEKNKALNVLKALGIAVPSNFESEKASAILAIASAATNDEKVAFPEDVDRIKKRYEAQLGAKAHDPEIAAVILDAAITEAKHMSILPPPHIKKQLELALGDDEKSKKFRSIINKTEDICDYLQATTKEPTFSIHKWDEQTPMQHNKFNNAYIWNKRDQRLYYNLGGTVKEIEFTNQHSKNLFSSRLTKELQNKSVTKLSSYYQEFLLLWTEPHIRGEKAGMIESHGKRFKTSLFAESYDYLTGPQDTEAKKKFASHINEAEGVFRKNALDIDRNIWRNCMKGLANFLSHITGIGIVLNVYNKVTTGNWFLFDETRSAQVVKSTVRDVASMLDVTPASQATIDKFKAAKAVTEALHLEQKKEDKLSEPPNSEEASAISPGKEP